MNFNLGSKNDTRNPRQRNMYDHAYAYNLLLDIFKEYASLWSHHLHTQSIHVQQYNNLNIRFLDQYILHSPSALLSWWNMTSWCIESTSMPVSWTRQSMILFVSSTVLRLFVLNQFLIFISVPGIIFSYILFTSNKNVWFFLTSFDKT